MYNRAEPSGWRDPPSRRAVRAGTRPEIDHPPQGFYPRQDALEEGLIEAATIARDTVEPHAAYSTGMKISMVGLREIVISMDLAT